MATQQLKTDHVIHFLNFREASKSVSRLSLTRDKIYKTVSRQLHGVVPCWVCGEHVMPEASTLEHIQPLSEGGNSHLENLAISHDFCNNQRHALGTVTPSQTQSGKVQRRSAVQTTTQTNRPR